MQQLESNSKRLGEINSSLQLNSTDSVKTLLKVSAELKASKEELQMLKQELTRLQGNLLIAKSLSQSQQDLLQQTNASFAQFAKEQKLKQASLRRERTLWQIVGLAAGIFAATR